MNTIDVYSQYFSADCIFHEVPRRAAVVALTCTSGGGEVRYTVSVSFFPHRDEEDYAISYDAYSEKEIFYKSGRRSKKREETLLQDLRAHADELASAMNGTVFWDAPLREARRG